MKRINHILNRILIECKHTEQNRKVKEIKNKLEIKLIILKKLMQILSEKINSKINQKHKDMSVIPNLNYIQIVNFLLK